MFFVVWYSRLASLLVSWDVQCFAKKARGGERGLLLEHLFVLHRFFSLVAFFFLLLFV
jgi:hypothetical protein